MAADIKRMIDNLLGFYDFNNKTIISVGAGGGQFIEYGRYSKQVMAVDIDQEALSKLEIALKKNQLAEKFILIHSDFFLLNQKADVVMFEFCLHEMENAEAAIKHALTLAPSVLINDHWTNSEWAFIVDEKEKVSKSWSAVMGFNLKKVQQYDTIQFFHDYDELYQKVNGQGENTISRIIKYKGRKDFTIPMTYGFALI
jgi:tRNA G37 N-methylase Trm5